MEVWLIDWFDWLKSQNFHTNVSKKYNIYYIYDKYNKTVNIIHWKGYKFCR